jgi:hypothetical protein
MAIKADRLKEVVEYYCSHGTQATLTAFPEINVESLNRYKREYKRKHGDLSDVTARLLDKFSAEQLEHLVEMDTTRKPYPTIKADFSGETIKFLAMGDDHIGSIYFDSNNLLAAFDEAHKQGCEFLINTGDIIEGMSGRAGHIYELNPENGIGYKAQREEAIRLYKQWGKPSYVLAGNHSDWINTKQDAGLDVVEDIAAAVPEMTYLGVHEGYIDCNGVKLGVMHGNDPSGSYAFSYRLQKIAEMFTGGTKPAALFVGHSHKAIYIYDRNIHMVSTGALQYQSGFMRSKRIPCHTGFWIIEMVVGNGEIKRFSPTWFPYYK